MSNIKCPKCKNASRPAARCPVCMSPLLDALAPIVAEYKALDAKSKRYSYLFVFFLAALGIANTMKLSALLSVAFLVAIVVCFINLFSIKSDKDKISSLIKQYDPNETSITSVIIGIAAIAVAHELAECAYDAVHVGHNVDMDALQQSMTTGSVVDTVDANYMNNRSVDYDHPTEDYDMDSLNASYSTAIYSVDAGYSDTTNTQDDLMPNEHAINSSNAIGNNTISNSATGRTSHEFHRNQHEAAASINEDYLINGIDIHSNSVQSLYNETFALYDNNGSNIGYVDHNDLFDRVTSPHGKTISYIEHNDLYDRLSGAHGETTGYIEYNDYFTRLTDNHGVSEAYVENVGNEIQIRGKTGFIDTYIDGNGDMYSKNGSYMGSIRKI